MGGDKVCFQAVEDGVKGVGRVAGREIELAAGSDKDKVGLSLAGHVAIHVHLSFPSFFLPWLGSGVGGG
jgi:hypothetical protein